MCPFRNVHLLTKLDPKPQNQFLSPTQSVMADTNEEEFPVPAEEHAMPRPTAAQLKPPKHARLPKAFLGAAETDPELAVKFAKMGGYTLELGSRAEVAIYPVVGEETMAQLVMTNDNCNELMTKFQAGSAKQCLEIAVIVSGTHSEVLIPDVAVRSEIPLRPSQRGASTNSRTFITGGMIEVSKSFKCESLGGQNLKKFYMAKCTDFFFRFKLPFITSKGAAKVQTFTASCLAAIHLGATGSGMSVRQPSPSSFCSCFSETSLKYFPKLVAGAPRVWQFWLR